MDILQAKSRKIAQNRFLALVGLFFQKKWGTNKIKIIRILKYIFRPNNCAIANFLVGNKLTMRCHYFVNLVW